MTEPVAPSPAEARCGGAWDRLRATSAHVTGDARPGPRGWFARLGGALFAGREPPAAPATAAPAAPGSELPTDGFVGVAEPQFTDVTAIERFGRSGTHERLELFPAAPAPPQQPAFDEGSLPPDFIAEHHRTAVPTPVAAYAVAGGVLWSTGLVTLGRQFVAPRDCLPAYWRANFSPGAAPLAHYHAGALGRHDVRTLTPGQPIIVATHPNLGHGRFLLEILPRLWLASVLRERGANFRLALSITLPPRLHSWTQLLHRDDDVLWYDGETERVRAPSTVLPGMLHNDYHLHPAMNHMVADLLSRVPPPDIPSPKYVFLTPSGFGNEHLENVGQAEAALQGLGFAAVRLSDLNAPAQIGLFAGAEVIVGEYGESLYGALFAPPGTRIVAINFANHYLSEIGRLRGHRIAFVPPADGKFRHWRLGSGHPPAWTVDPARLRQVVEAMMQAGADPRPG